MLSQHNKLKQMSREVLWFNEIWREAAQNKFTKHSTNLLLRMKVSSVALLQCAS